MIGGSKRYGWRWPGRAATRRPPRAKALPRGPLPRTPLAQQPGEEPEKSFRLRVPEGAAGVLVFSLAFLLAMYAAALIYLRPASEGRRLSLDQVISRAATRQVQEVTVLDQDARVVGTMKQDRAPGRFWSAYPSSDAATNDLLRTFLSSGAEVNVDSQASKSLVRFVAQFLLPLVVLANLFALLFSLSRSNKSAASPFVSFGEVGERKLGTREKSRSTFDDVASAEEAIAELAEVRDYLGHPKAFEKMGALPPKGVLLTGPPGCGKTLLARAVAGEANANFFSMSGSEFVESLVGVGASRVRDLFQQGRAAAPAIIFIDELDAVGRRRGAGLGGGHDEREQTLNELLVQIDGFSPSEGVVVMGATNRPDILDPALLRAGRFERQVNVEHPDLDGRLEILRLHAKGRRLENPAGDLPHIARQAAGFTGADLAHVVNEAALLAVREKAAKVARRHLEEAVERVLSGPRRKVRIISADERRRIAYHEAGHAMVAAALGRGQELTKVSIIARGRGIGHLGVLQEDKTILTRRDMQAQITLAMGGLAAEELVFGEPSSGAEHDLERATNVARDMAGRFGMSSRLGRARVLHQHGEVFLGRDYLSTNDVSQPTLEHLDEEVRAILDHQEAQALDILSDQRDILDGMAETLVARETVQGSDLDEWLASVRPYVERDRYRDVNGRGARRRAPVGRE